MAACLTRADPARFVQHSTKPPGLLLVTQPIQTAIDLLCVGFTECLRCFHIGGLSGRSHCSALSFHMLAPRFVQPDAGSWPSIDFRNHSRFCPIVVATAIQLLCECTGGRPIDARDGCMSGSTSPNRADLRPYLVSGASRECHEQAKSVQAADSQGDGWRPVGMVDRTGRNSTIASSSSNWSDAACFASSADGLLRGKHRGEPLRYRG